ncbi:unnamed protein product, partial [Ectocarpus sp. 12 AP-2014]
LGDWAGLQTGPLLVSSSRSPGFCPTGGCRRGDRGGVLTRREAEKPTRLGDGDLGGLILPGEEPAGKPPTPPGEESDCCDGRDDAGPAALGPPAAGLDAGDLGKSSKRAPGCCRPSCSSSSWGERAMAAGRGVRCDRLPLVLP